MFIFICFFIAMVMRITSLMILMTNYFSLGIVLFMCMIVITCGTMIVMLILFLILLMMVTILIMLMKTLFVFFIFYWIFWISFLLYRAKFISVWRNFFKFILISTNMPLNIIFVKNFMLMNLMAMFFICIIIMRMTMFAVFMIFRSITG